MAQTALFTSPMAKKKIVSSKYKPNSFRVISTDAEVFKPENKEHLFKLADINVVGQPTHIHPWTEHRHNQPNANHLDFLRHDVRLLNEPVCNVYTSDTHTQQSQWWPSRYSKETLATPPHTQDTTMRHDYSSPLPQNQGFTRHQSNPNKTPARGTVPVNFLPHSGDKKTLLQEGISFEHQYNCREDPSYSIRSRRQGAFVWDPMSAEKSENLIKYSTSISNMGSTSHETSPVTKADHEHKIQTELSAAPAKLSEEKTSPEQNHQTTTSILPTMSQASTLTQIDFM